MDEIGVMLKLVRAALEGKPAEVGPLEASHWWRLFRLAQQNHVAALVADTLPAGVPRDVLIPWLAEREKAVARQHFQREVQQEVVDVMQRQGIKTLVLKGTHTAAYYPNPELREFGDLDLYFYDRHDEADAVAARELRVKIDRAAHHHTRYSLRGITIESHFDFVNTHYPPSNRRYETLLKELTTHRSPLSAPHSPFSTHEVLFLLRHMAGHFAASRITLRDLVDWALTCRTLKDDVDWKMVEETIVEYGMTDFVAALGSIISERLGIEMPLRLPKVDVTAVERDIVLGSDAATETGADGLPRLGWKLRRWKALGWKRRMVYNDPVTSLFLASLTSHAEKPHSILHKM